jgi:RNA polymerase sigma-70 factor, ECF subfamily
MNDPGTMDNSSAGNGEVPSASTSLLRLARQMNSGAWGRIVDVFGPIIYRWARTSGLAAEDAADVVQDVLALIVRNLDKFEKAKESGSFRSWIATITRNRVRDYFRKQGHEQRGIGGTTAWEMLQNVGGEPESEALEKSISLDSMNRLLPARVLEIVRAECEPRTWQAFWLTTVDQRSANDIAAELGMNVAAVYQAKSRVLRRLRKSMSEMP